MAMDLPDPEELLASTDFADCAELFANGLLCEGMSEGIVRKSVSGVESGQIALPKKTAEFFFRRGEMSPEVAMEEARFGAFDAQAELEHKLRTTNFSATTCSFAQESQFSMSPPRDGNQDADDTGASWRNKGDHTVARHVNPSPPRSTPPNKHDANRAPQKETHEHVHIHIYGNPPDPKFPTEGAQATRRRRQHKGLGKTNGGSPLVEQRLVQEMPTLALLMHQLRTDAERMNPANHVTAPENAKASPASSPFLSTGDANNSMRRALRLEF